jgi:hypothetical protein
MLHFYSRVQQWTSTYSWSAVLKLAPNWHGNVISTSQLAVDSWRNVPLEWIDYYLSASTLASRLVKKARSDTNLKSQQPDKASLTNVPSQNCRNLNTEEGCPTTGANERTSASIATLRTTGRLSVAHSNYNPRTPKLAWPSIGSQTLICKTLEAAF